MKHVCKNCGNELAEGSLFCNKCGEKLELNLCPSCGKELTEDSKFCIYCGAKVKTEEAAPTEVKNAPESLMTAVTEVPFTEAPQEEPKEQPKDLKAIIVKHADYYTTEFDKIKNGEKSKFNWAAFIFNGIFAYYRKSQDIFWKQFKTPMILMVILNILTVSTGYFAFTNVFENPTILAVWAGCAGILNLAFGIYMLIVDIRFAKNFNYNYYQKIINGNAQSGVSKKNAFLYCLVVSVYTSIMTALTIILMVSGISSSFDAGFDDSIYDDYTTSIIEDVEDIEDSHIEIPVSVPTNNNTNTVTASDFVGEYWYHEEYDVEGHVFYDDAYMCIEPISDTECSITMTCRGNTIVDHLYVNDDDIENDAVALSNEFGDEMYFEYLPGNEVLGDHAICVRLIPNDGSEEIEMIFQM